MVGAIVCHGTPQRASHIMFHMTSHTGQHGLIAWGRQAASVVHISRAYLCIFAGVSIARCRADPAPSASHHIPRTHLVASWPHRRAELADLAVLSISDNST